MQNQKSRFVISSIRSLNLYVFVFLMVAGVLGFGGSAQAVDYYVSPTTTSTDWATAQNINTPCIAQTAMANAVAGDTVYFRGGTYAPLSCVTEWEGFSPSNSGTSGAPVAFIAYPGETVIVDTNLVCGGWSFLHQSWIVIDGFEITDCNGAIYFGPDGTWHDITIQNCSIHNNDKRGNAGGIYVRRSSASYNLKIINNSFHDNLGDGGVNDASIETYDTNNLTVHGNFIYNTGANRNTGVGIYLKYGCNNALICQNTIYDIVRGIRFDEGDDSQIYENVIYGCWAGIHIYNAGVNNLSVYSNTIYSSRDCSGEERGIYLQESVGTGTILYNNIVDCAGVGYYGFRGLNNLNYDNQGYNNAYNCGGREYSEIIEGPNSIQQDSLFTNLFEHDYHLQDGSPCIGAGKGGFDIGAYPLGSGPDTIPPSRSNPQPTGTLTSGTTSTTISLDTNETAVCKYSETPNTAYDDILNTFSTTNSTSHSQTISGLSDGETKTYYVRCQDESGNSNTDDFEISFSIATHTTYSISNFINLVTNWLKTESGLTSDINGDGVVNTRDLGIMMSNWQ